MKLATWNCAMRLPKNYQQFVDLGANVAVIQECSQRFAEQINRTDGWSSAWFGNNPNKGLAVLVRAPWTVREARALKPQWAGKLVIDGPVSIELFAVWACKGNNPTEEYIGQIHLLLDIIERTPVSPYTIVIGDLNSNSQWDRDYGIRNHSSAVDRFRKLGLESAYHVFSGDLQGAERDPTHWNLKQRNAAYHIDYAFLSPPLVSKIRNVTVGHCDDWISFSDHAPVLIELDL